MAIADLRIILDRLLPTYHDTWSNFRSILDESRHHDMVNWSKCNIKIKYMSKLTFLFILDCTKVYLVVSVDNDEKRLTHG